MNETSPPLGHNYVNGVCTRCDAGAVTYTFVPAVDPTCTTPGNVAYLLGSDNKWYDPTTTNQLYWIALNAIGHSYGAWTTNTPPTCTTAGEETRACIRGDVSETRPLAALGHDWTAWMVVAPATYAASGEEARDCTRCDAHETHVLPMLQRSSTFSRSNSGRTFTVTRSSGTATETVHYRTVGLSAYGGQHFTGTSGSLTFDPGVTNLSVTVTEQTPSQAAYKFQTGNSRYYRFEITDAGGFLVTNATRTLTTGTSVPSSGAFGVKNLTIQSAEYTADDRGYDNNGYKSVSSNGYFAAAAPRPYFQLVDAQLHMTLSMSAKENDDAYEYLQLLFNNTSACDNRSGCNNGNPGNISLSAYMAGFEMDTGSKDSTYRNYTFPVTNVGNNAGAANPWGHGTTSPLSMQKYNTATGSRASDGRIVVPLDFSSIVLRLNASGSSGSDEWAAKSVVAHVQAVDTAAPARLATAVAPGIRARGNEFYVSVAFSEPVTCSSATLTNSWGTLTYNSGNGSNVLTFKGTIGANVSGALNITGWSGNIKDLAGNPLGATALTQKNLATIDASHAYAIAYDLAGGALPEGASNHDTYTYETPSFTLANPLRPGYAFAGWTEGNGSTPNPSVAIYRSHGDRAYTANWTPVTYFVHFDPGTADATGSMPDQSFTYDTPQAIASNAFTRAGYTFTGWRGADGAIYPDRTTVLNLTNAQDAVVSLTATWRPNIPYIDEDGTERLCTNYTVLTDATSGVTYGEFGATAWYVVTNAVTISGQLGFRGTSHLILCGGASLAVTNEDDIAIDANDLTIYGQTNGSGAVTATGTNGGGIYAGSVTINGGNVTAEGGNGICAVYGSVTINGGTVTAESGPGGGGWGIYANNGSIILGWTNPTDSITASSYYTGGSVVRVKDGQVLTDGSAIYMDDLTHSAIAGVTLRPYIDTPTYPAYLGLPADSDDDTDEDFDIRANYDAWAQRYGYDALGANETAYLLDVAPWAVTNGVTPLKVAEMGVTNILVREAGDFGWVAQRMGYTGDTLPIWRLVLASDVAPLKDGFYDSLMVCNGYLVLRIGTDLSVPKSEWLETGWFARVEDGRAELLCPEFILEKYRERVARETGKPCPGLFLSVTLSPRQSSSTAFAEILEEELGDKLQ